MPRHEECRKTNPCFPKNYEDIVGHIMTEVNFFTPSEPGRSVKPGAIISRVESLQILKNDLRKLALEKNAAELREARTERRGEMLAQIERDVQKEVRRRGCALRYDWQVR